MSGALRMPISVICGLMVIAAMAFSIFVHAQSPKEINGSGGAKEKLIGAWQLPESANTLSNEYVLNGYEASFGSYEGDEIAFCPWLLSRRQHQLTWLRHQRW